jgi:hypothetical protein
MMTITLPLHPLEEARLLARSEETGLAPDVIVREALDKALSLDPVATKIRAPQVETRPIWEVILETMADVPESELARLPRDGASEVDHYLYGHPRRK